MSETASGGAESPIIELPSPLRIRQRLGMIATSNSYREVLAPAIARLGGETMTAHELVLELETTTADYAQEHRYGIVRQVQNGIPDIIDQIIDDPSQKNATLDAWEAHKAALIDEDEKVEERFQRRRLSRHRLRQAKRRGLN